VKKPDFFVVGAPKCGTTSLCKYLDQHPDIFISKPKEPHYFGQDLAAKPRRGRTLEKYLSLFEGAKNKVCGEGSTRYLYSKVAAKHIYELNPDAKIIIMLRNPVDFLYSFHSQLLVDLAEDIPDFQLALEAESDRREGKRIPRDAQRPADCLYSEVAKFSEQVKRYFDTFGREQVYVIIFDDFKSDIARVYRETLEFLEVDASFQFTDFKNHKPNARIKNIALFRRKQRIKRWIISVGSLVPMFPGRAPLKKLLLKRINRIMRPASPLEKVSREPMDPELRKHLKKQFAPEVERLSNLLGRDLSHWSLD
jgi:hypothetical protein